MLKQDISLRDLEFITDLSPSESERCKGGGCPGNCLCGIQYPDWEGKCPPGYKPTKFGDYGAWEHWQCCK